MIEEIIYTSAEKGLKAGSRGFCTVVSTAGMAINMAERLESMSGYRHAFPLQSPQAVLNPINHSHVTMRIGGKLVHVLSRIADAGQDYSGRTNKLAHHLAMDDVSRFVSGPARLMEQSGVLVTSWDGHIRTMAPRNVVGAPMPGSVTLSAWKRVTGDSGWAGWVAEQLSQDKAPVSVIFAAGTETLLLVREVLDLLPPSQRWGVTFSTYFTKLLAGTECQLRFVLDDTPEATALRNDARAKVVDLLRKNPPAIGGALVQQARTELIQLEPSAPSPKPVAKPQASSSKPPVRSAERTAERTPDEDSDTYRMSKPSLPGAVPSRPSLPPRLGDRVFDTPEAPSLRRFETSREKKNRMPLIIGVVAVLMFCAGVGLTILLMSSDRSHQRDRATVTVDENETNRNQGDNANSEVTGTTGADPARNGQTSTESNDVAKDTAKAPPESPPTNPPTPQEPAKADDPVEPSREEVPFDPFFSPAATPHVAQSETKMLRWQQKSVDDSSVFILPLTYSESNPISVESISVTLPAGYLSKKKLSPNVFYCRVNSDKWSIDYKSDPNSTEVICLGSISLITDQQAKSVQLHLKKSNEWSSFEPYCPINVIVCGRKAITFTEPVRALLINDVAPVRWVDFFGGPESGPSGSIPPSLVSCLMLETKLSSGSDQPSTLVTPVANRKQKRAEVEVLECHLFNSESRWISTQDFGSEAVIGALRPVAEIERGLMRLQLDAFVVLRPYGLLQMVRSVTKEDELGWLTAPPSELLGTAFDENWRTLSRYLDPDSKEFSWSKQLSPPSKVTSVLMSKHADEFEALKSKVKDLQKNIDDYEKDRSSRRELLANKENRTEEEETEFQFLSSTSTQAELKLARERRDWLSKRLEWIESTSATVTKNQLDLLQEKVASFHLEGTFFVEYFEELVPVRVPVLQLTVEPVTETPQ